MKAIYRLFYYISIIMTVVLGGITLIGAFVCYISPYQSIILSFIGLILPILLLLNLFMAFYWSIRWKYWVFIPLTAILGNCGYLSSVLQFPLWKPASLPLTENFPVVSLPDSTIMYSANFPSELVIVTYNMNSINQKYDVFSFDIIAECMKKQKADILCFQEFGFEQNLNVDSICTILSEWDYHYIPITPIDREPLLQLAVFSRYPILEKKLVTYPNSKNCTLRCDIDVNGRIIRILNNHLQTTLVSYNKRQIEKELKKKNYNGAKYASRSLMNDLSHNFKMQAVQANVVRQLVDTSPYPTLVCGDFNSLPSSYTYHTIKGNKLKDGFQTCGHGYMYTYRYLKYLLRIDYILHTSDFEGIDYYSPHLKYSDHNPVVMKLRF